jgi:hypothetical protein
MSPSLTRPTRVGTPECVDEGRSVVTERDPEQDEMMEHPDLDQATGSDEHGPIFKAPDLEQEEEGDGS